jgi:hypothetical protein
MKKMFLSALAVFVLTVVSMAQGFHFGAKAGANLGKIKGTDFTDEFKLGYHVGAFASIDFSKGFGIQPELLWNQTNTTVTDEPLSGLKPGSDIKLNYLSVPVLLRFNPSKMLTINVGPEFGILTNNHKTVAGNAVNAFKGGDFSMAAGLQVNLGAFNVYGRYNIGLSNVNDITDKDEWKKQTIQFGLGLRIL